jgi:hypothetical protein
MLVVRVTRERAGLDGFAAPVVGANEHTVRGIELDHRAQLVWDVGGPLAGHIGRVVVVLFGGRICYHLANHFACPCCRYELHHRKGTLTLR